MKKYVKKYWHIVFALYLPIYLISFFYLEQTVTTHFYALNSPLDDMVPFVGAFIVPYILWFLYVAIGCIYFFFASQREFTKFILFLILGMTTYLFICYLYPNGLCDFRPATLDADSVFTPVIRWLYATDTSTNVFPSIHVYNSIAVHTAISHSGKINKPVIKYSSMVLCILICLSTIFLKQHALIDVIGGCVMAGFFYNLVYKTELTKFIDKHTLQ